MIFYASERETRADASYANSSGIVLPVPAPYQVPCAEAPPVFSADCSVGVLGSAVGIIGSIQATETIKYITGIGTLLTDRLLVADASTMTFNTISLPRNPKCPLCSEK